MKIRVRAAGLLVDAHGRLLLVMDRTAGDPNRYWWGPPGGGMEEQDESLPACLRREVLEETGLLVEPGRLIFIRDFIEPETDTHHVDLYFEVHNPQGRMFELDPGDPPTGSDPRRYARWFSQEEMQPLYVSPKELKTIYWKHHRLGITQTQYLGVSFE